MMRDDYEEIKAQFKSINPTLKEIASKLEDNLKQVFQDTEHIDRISCRVKDEESFMAKTLKRNDDNSLKYSVPLKEIQDFIGARIIVYYKSDFDPISEIVHKYFPRVEKVHVVPDDISKFGYEGLHIICFIPSSIYSTHKSNPPIPDFFELQIRTLYQHAWSQSQHGLGYKPDILLSEEEKRRLAFLAAQSWGADTILEDLINEQKKKRF